MEEESVFDTLILFIFASDELHRSSVNVLPDDTIFFWLVKTRKLRERER